MTVFLEDNISLSLSLFLWLYGRNLGGKKKANRNKRRMEAYNGTEAVASVGAYFMAVL